MPQVTINNVDVDFPFTPYKCQEDYMSHVIRALQSKKNAILESPTGTGKTLCLLCSVLAWRLTYIAKLQLSGMAGGVEIAGLNEAAGGGEGKTEAFSAIPKIIYASRTHSQISQVVKELKNTIYKPKISVLGSRDQLCLHPKVMNIENSMAKIHTCRAKVKDRSCVHYTNVDKKINDTIFNEILDIEELVSVSKEKTMCPYYSSRELLRRADIIFMPYNYLIDQKTRKNQNIGLENAIIIFDEAHNIEKVCEESYSFEITSLDIANCIENCQLTLARILEDGGDSMSSGGGLVENNELTKEDVLTMKAIFLSLEREFNKIEVKGEGCVLEKSTFKNLLYSINVNKNTKDLITEVLQKMEAVLSMSTNNKLVGNTFTVLNNFMQILDLTLDQTDSSSQVYVCHVSKERKDKKGYRGDFSDRAVESVIPQFATKLSYWCFCPGLAMQEFARSGVFSIILTSGTLSPLSSFSSELRIPFPITLQNPHVIEAHQISVQVICKGCDGTEFLSTYQNRENPRYLSSLGNSIVNLLRIIPSGVLVFFPSYTVMNKTIEFWQNHNIYTRISKVKHCFVEPRKKGEMASMMSEFDARVRNPGEGATGAILFAVCRGKASEGIDFADTHGRAVIITGLPFPPRVDPKVSAKMTFLDQLRRSKKDGMTGQEWYIQQATRAVNQAVGRVIRHKNDFGAVILMDKRFSYKSNVDQLPKWARPFVKLHEKFGSGLRELAQFFKVHVAKEVVLEEGVVTLNTAYKGRMSNMYDQFQQREKDKPLPEEPETPPEPTPPPRKVTRTGARTSLLSSLTCSSSGFSCSPAISPLTSRRPTEEYTTPEGLRNPRKRIRIVKSGTGSTGGILQKENLQTVVETMGGATQVSQSGPSSQSGEGAKYETEKGKKSKEYSGKLRSTLSIDEFKVFRGIVAEYKTNNSMPVLIESLSKLFLPNHRGLLSGFRVFLSAKHQGMFDGLIADKI